MTRADGPYTRALQPAKVDVDLVANAQLLRSSKKPVAPAIRDQLLEAALRAGTEGAHRAGLPDQAVVQDLPCRGCGLDVPVPTWLLDRFPGWCSATCHDRHHPNQLGRCSRCP